MTDILNGIVADRADALRPRPRGPRATVNRLSEPAARPDELERELLPTVRTTADRLLTALWGWS